jgi:hypothetical protein
MKQKSPTDRESSVVASVEAEMDKPRLTESVRQGLDSEAVRLQIAILQRSLADNERSWKATGLARIENPVATSIRWDIAEKEKLLSAAS